MFAGQGTHLLQLPFLWIWFLGHLLHLQLRPLDDCLARGTKRVSELLRMSLSLTDRTLVGGRSQDESGVAAAYATSRIMEPR